jgi:hypothetical protein
MTETHPFLSAFRGSFSGILRWPQLDELWETVRTKKTNDWYIYAVGEIPPEQTVDSEQVEQFITEIDKLIRNEHKEDYCGLVYVDDRQDPEFIKIFDPNNMGVVCGYSDNPPLPGWILSKIQPADLPTALPAPGNRKRWWQRLFGS